MERITEKMLQMRIDRLNTITENPLTPYSKGEDGKHRANVGNYRLDIAYGGYALEQMCNDGGGVNSVLSRGTKRELFDKLCALIRGIEIGRGQQ